MADGNSTLLNFIIGVDTEGESKLDRFKKKVDNLKNSVGNGADDMKNSFDSLRDSMGVVSDEGDEMESSFMRATGQGLALLFAGRFLSQTFGGLANRMNDLVGISDMMSGAIISVLAPAFAALTEPVSRVTSWFMELDEDIKMLIGSFVAAMAVIAPIIMILGQLAAMAAAFGISVVGLISAISGVVAIIVIVGAALILLERRFGAVSIMVEALTRVFEGAVKVIRHLIRGEWREAADFLYSAMKEAIDATIQTFRDMGSRVLDILSGLASDSFDEAKNLGSRIIDGIRTALENNKEIIRNAIQAMLPPGINLEMLERGGSAAISGAQGLASRVNDFVIDDGRILKTHPNDVIMGTKNPDSLGGGGGDDIDIRIDNPTVSDDRDIDKIVREVERVLDRRSGGRGLTR